MALLEIVPRFRALLHQCGLSSARSLLDWNGVILSGHPSRHVLRVNAGEIAFILKKEHRVPWSDRFASAWAGFGWTSKSVREARLLARLRASGVPCPEVAASGEDGGQAFVLLREQAGMSDLRDFLAHLRLPADRRALARALGRELARIHAAGFSQPDLYAKHILVRPARAGFRFCFLDWQRSREHRIVPWRRRLRDLAVLDASLAAELASDRLRLVCLRAYLRDAAALGLFRWKSPVPLPVAIRSTSAQRLERRRTRELRQPPLPKGAQQLVWLQGGERLCVAHDFYEELGGLLPSWLPQQPAPSPDGPCVEHRLILLGAGRTAHLVERWSSVTAGWLHSGKFPAPELARAAAIFRLQRFGVPGPRLLAMGHRRLTAFQRYSFLLTEPPTGAALGSMLRQDTAPALRHRLLRLLGGLLRQIHEAGYALRPDADPWQMWVATAAPPLTLSSVDSLDETKMPWQQRGWTDLQRFFTGSGRSAAALSLSRADRLRLVLGYLKARRLDARTRRLLEQMVPRERRAA
jgi:tRNA A-37 threonylcarbamoyl transferase component Bud32